MTGIEILEIVNYCLILIFGVLLSIAFSGGCKNKKQKIVSVALSPILLLIQGTCWLIWDLETVRLIYPLAVHLPIIITLVFLMKRRVSVAVISVCTAYLCCQIPRWINLVSFLITKSRLIESITYTVFIFVVFYLLYRYFSKAAHSAMTYSPKTMVLFGSLPILYYVFDYATAVYSDALYSGIKALIEFLPTATIAFYIIFISAYHKQMQERADAEHQRAVIEESLKRSEIEIEALRHSDKQSSLYRHDMRHHMNILDGMLGAENVEQARSYINQVCADIENVSRKRFCENETANLIFASFTSRAERLGIKLCVSAKISQPVPLSDTELCSLLSNGLENAVNALSEEDELSKKIELYCDVVGEKLLIEIKNPCTKEVEMSNGIPVSSREGHGYGCQSIYSIVEKHGGLCKFTQNDGVFSLRVILPM